MAFPLLLPLLAGGGAGMAGMFGANKSNKALKKLQGYDPTPYSGPTPPEFKNLRPVEQQITDILMRRSLGQDVGFDPRRRKELQDIYDIDYKSQMEEGTADIMNQLAGTGLSRNLAARDAMLGKMQRSAQDARSKYLMGLDVEDLTTRQQEKMENTRNLQRWGEFGFAQENQRADFGKDVWAQQEANRLSGVNVANQNLLNQQAYKEDPWGSAIQSGLSVFGALKPQEKQEGTTTQRSGDIFDKLSLGNVSQFGNLRKGLSPIQVLAGRK